MSKLLVLLSQYEVLAETAKYLSSLDLHHLGLTSSDFYAVILQRSTLLDPFKRTNLCDGTGLTARQEYQGMYMACADGPNRTLFYDDELEVRVWNIKCDEVNALPCIKCGINVCEVRWLHWVCLQSPYYLLGVSICSTRTGCAKL
jgi:hypothetical protein